MRVALVHGYFLHDSGSGVYVRELARALVRLGHEVTLVCQEREPERYEFIDDVYTFGEDGAGLTRSRPARGPDACRCRLVRPWIGGRLLTYVEGDFPGFPADRVRSFQASSAEERERYVTANIEALRAAFDEWPPDLVLAQHLIMQPFVVARALRGRAPYVVTEHGSALNFSVRRCPYLAPYALEGLSGARAIVTVSEGARADLVHWAGEHGMDISDKTLQLSPGIDGELFAPAASREAAIAALRAAVPLPEGFDVCADDDIVAFAGALRPTKGVQYAVAAMPTVEAARGRRMRFLIAGDGPALEPLERLSKLLSGGETAAATALATEDERIAPAPGWGPVVPASPVRVAIGDSAAFLGHLSHDELAAVFAAADVALAPSVFPEAAALVNGEALAAGALPLSTYHSGMVSLVDFLAESLGEPSLRDLAPGRDLTTGLAALIVHVLDGLPTREREFRQRLHDLALSRFATWEAVAERYVGFASQR